MHIRMARLHGGKIRCCCCQLKKKKSLVYLRTQFSKMFVLSSITCELEQRIKRFSKKYYEILISCERSFTHSFKVISHDNFRERKKLRNRILEFWYRVKGLSYKLSMSYDTISLEKFINFHFSWQHPQRFLWRHPNIVILNIENENVKKRVIQNSLKSPAAAMCDEFP